MNIKWIIVGVAVLVGSIGMGGWLIMSEIEQAQYQKLETHGTIEIRRYAPMTIAYVQVDGQRQEAIRKGFRLLADYIFGENNTKEKIAMTAPVQQQWIENAWRISFVMPSAYRLVNLPRPKNERIQHIQQPARRMIAIQFSGRQTEQNIRKHETQLRHYIQSHHMQIIDSAHYAFYNPPWTLPFLRRHEVMFELPD